MIFEVRLIRTIAQEESAKVRVQSVDKNTLGDYIIKEGLDELTDVADDLGLWNRMATKEPIERFEWIEETKEEPHLSISFLVERRR